MNYYKFFDTIFFISIFSQNYGLATTIIVPCTCSSFFLCVVHLIVKGLKTLQRWSKNTNGVVNSWVNLLKNPYESYTEGGGPPQLYGSVQPDFISANKKGTYVNNFSIWLYIFLTSIYIKKIKETKCI